jgi:hypothetical protein
MANRLDLRKDFADIYAWVDRRVQTFNPDTNDGPGDAGPITRIDIGYGFEQSGWVALVFDTRPDAEPDGEWTMHIDGNDLERPHWVSARETNEDHPLEVMLPDGSNRELPPGADGELATFLGELLRGVLLKARADGLFAALPKAPQCELGVEEQEGGYGWPVYEARGQDNLAGR